LTDVDEATRGEASGSIGRTTRRALIAGIAAGVTGLVADSMITSVPAGAAEDTATYVELGVPNPATGTTEISYASTPGAATLQCDDGETGTSTGPALAVVLNNPANAAAAIEASTAGAGAAISAAVNAMGATAIEINCGDSEANTGFGVGLTLNINNTANDFNAMEVTTAGGGYAIYALCTLSTNLTAVIAATQQGLGNAVQISVPNPVNVKPALTVSTAGKGPAIATTDEVDGVGSGSQGGGGIVSTISQASNFSPPFIASTKGRGPAIRSTVDNVTSGGAAIEGTVNGVGPAVIATTTGTGHAIEGVITAPDNNSAAVSGATSGVGSGVAGSAATGAAIGVSGSGAHGAMGVKGTSDTGVGVRASSTTGIALEVAGRVSLSRSGVVAVPAKGRTIKVDLDGVTPESMVFATLQQASGTVLVANVVPEASSFTINLSQAAPSAVRVAWMVLD
jgi:trimeric autotransporter adhesin